MLHLKSGDNKSIFLMHYHATIQHIRFMLFKNHTPANIAILSYAHYFCALLLLSILTLPIYAQVGDYLILEDDSYLEVPDNNVLDFSTNLSVEAWINLCDVTSGTHTIISKIRCNANQASYSLRIVAGGKLQWRWSEEGTCSSAPFDGGLYSTTAEVVNQTDKWYHIAITHTPTSVKIYIDGVEVSGVLQSGNYSTIFNSNQALRIGVSIGGPTGIEPVGYLNCFIDEVRLWDYPLTALEIAAHAAESPLDNGLIGIEPGLTAYYNMSIPIGSPAIPPSNINNIAIATGSMLNATAQGGDADSPFYVSAGIDLNNLNFGENMTVCRGEPFILDVSNVGLKFLWSDGNTTASRIIDQDGLYAVTVTLGNCWVSDSIYLSFEGGTDTVKLHQCGGDPPYFLQGEFRYQSGTYYDTIPTNLSCDSIRVVLLDINEYLVAAEEISLCAGEQYELNSGLLVSNAGIYFDTLKQQNGNCDSLIRILQFKVNDYITQERIDSVCWGESVWLAGKAQTKAGIYIDTVNTNACDTIYKTHLISYDCRHIGCQMIMPDAFSPNQDGINDRFQLFNPCELRKVNWEIYNRLGQRVFYSQDANQMWDGKTNNQDCELGVYAYTISFEALDAEKGFWRPKIQSGSIVLIR